MDWYSVQVPVVPLVVARQGITPVFGQNQNYESGRKVGQILAYVVIGVIVLAVLLKLFKSR